jgi:hypothetical protein
MVLLKQCKNNGNRKKKEVILMESVEDAVAAGQKSGFYYEVIDLVSGRVIDWNEVNIRPEEEWYYDDSELLWKRRSDETIREKAGNSLIDWLLGRKEENTPCRFSY